MISEDWLSCGFAGSEKIRHAHSPTLHGSGSLGSGLFERSGVSILWWHTDAKTTATLYNVA